MISSTDRISGGFIPARQQPRLTPGERAMGVSHADKGADPSAPLEAVDLDALTSPNKSAHSGHLQTQANAIAEAGGAS